MRFSAMLHSWETINIVEICDFQPIWHQRQRPRSTIQIQTFYSESCHRLCLVFERGWWHVTDKPCLVILFPSVCQCSLAINQVTQWLVYVTCLPLPALFDLRFTFLLALSPWVHTSFRSPLSPPRWHEMLHLPVLLLFSFTYSFSGASSSWQYVCHSALFPIVNMSPLSQCQLRYN